MHVVKANSQKDSPANNSSEEARQRIAEVMRVVVSEMTSSDDLNVTFTVAEHTTIYNITVPQQFRGKLIGSQGRTILALRNILGAMAGNHGFRAIIELVI